MITERKLKNGNVRHYCPICGAAVLDEVKIGMEDFTIFGMPVVKYNFVEIKPCVMQNIPEKKFRGYVCSEHTKNGGK